MRIFSARPLGPSAMLSALFGAVGFSVGLALFPGSWPVGAVVAGGLSALAAPAALWARSRRRGGREAIWAVAGLIYALVCWRALEGRAGALDLGLWAGGAALALLPFILTLSPRSLLPARVRGQDAAIVAALVAVCVVLHAHDLREWYYAAIGDEFAFYLKAREILELRVDRPFATDGVYYNSPTLNSVYQALVMALFDGSAFGWKFSAILSLGLTVPPVYMIALRFSGRPAAVVAAAMTLGSHYLMAMSHTGYTHMDGLAVSAWAILAFMSGLRRRSFWLLLAAGALCGLSLHFALVGRVCFVLIALWTILSVRNSRELGALWPAALGLGLLALPFAFANGMETIMVMGRDPISPYSQYRSEVGDLLLRLAGNVANAFAWWHNPTHVSHYTSGSLLDVVSGALALAGIVVCALGRRRRHLFVLGWLVVTVVPTAILAPYSHPPLTRMFPTVLPLALAAGIMLGAACRVYDLRPAARAVGACVLVVLVVALNVWRFQYVTPGVMGSVTPEAVAVRAWYSDICEERADTLFVGRHPHLMELVIESYVSGGPRPVVTSEYADARVASAGACRVFFRISDPEARWLVDSDAGLVSFSNYAGLTRVLVAGPDLEIDVR